MPPYKVQWPGQHITLDLCTPDITHMTLSGVLDGKPTTSVSGCIHSPWKQSSGYTLAVWSLSEPKQHYGTFKGNIHNLSFPCNCASLVLASPTNYIPDHYLSPLPTHYILCLGHMTPACSTIVLPTTQHYHYHWPAIPVILTYKMYPLYQHSYSLRTIHPEFCGNKFLPCAGNYVAESGSICETSFTLCKSNQEV